MAGILTKIRSLFSRKGKENPNESSKEERPAKRMRYVSTPALVFTPKQIATKRKKRSCYILYEMVNTTEDRNYEFKLGGMMMLPITLRKLICKYAPAFLNAEGGVLIGGVRDDGHVVGLTLNYRKQDEVVRIVNDEISRCRPKVEKEMLNIKFVPVARHENDGNIRDLYVIEIYINKGMDNKIYENGQHEVFVRRDGGVQGPLRPLAIKDLVIEKYQKVLQDRKNLAENEEKKQRELKHLRILNENEETEEAESKDLNAGEKYSNSRPQSGNYSNGDSSLEIISVKPGNPNKKPLQPDPKKPVAIIKVNRERNKLLKYPVGNTVVGDITAPLPRHPSWEEERKISYRFDWF